MEIIKWTNINFKSLTHGHVPAANSTFAIGGVSCSANFGFYPGNVIGTNVVGQSPLLKESLEFIKFEETDRKWEQLSSGQIFTKSWTKLTTSSYYMLSMTSLSKRMNSQEGQIWKSRINWEDVKKKP